MSRRSSAAIAALALAFPLGTITAADASPGCRPYCDSTTIHIANKMDGTGHGAWLATVLDEGGYRGKRHAEITHIPPGHGKRFVGVIHVPAGKAKKVRAALSDYWFAESGTKFVLPLVTKYNTEGGAGPAFKKAAAYAKKKLGRTWTVH